MPPQKSQVRHFFTTLRAAKSTSWPGFTCAGVWILYFAVVTSYAHFTLILVLGTQMLQMSHTLWCHFPGTKSTGHWQDLPVTFTQFDGVSKIANLNVMETKFSLAFNSIVAPILPLFLASAFLCLHFSDFGCPNRDGIIGGLLIIITTCYNMYGDTLISPDAGDSAWHTGCYLEPASVTKFMNERKIRWSLMVAAEVLAGVTCLCGIIYLIFAIIATYKNRHGDVKADIKLEELHPRGESMFPDVEMQ